MLIIRGVQCYPVILLNRINTVRYELRLGIRILLGMDSSKTIAIPHYSKNLKNYGECEAN